MDIVTGYRGIAHITAGHTGTFNASIVGKGAYVLDSGEQFNINVLSNNQVQISDGDILLNGRHITIQKGNIETLTLENNASGTKRNDLIVCRYSKDTGTGVESAQLVVIKGQATSGTPADPSYNIGDILSGSEVVDMPLYRIPFESLTIGTPVKLFETIDSVEALHEALKALETNMNTKLAGKSDTNHNHNSSYYTKTETENKLKNKSDTSHNHDGRYQLPVGAVYMGSDNATHKCPMSYGTWSYQGNHTIEIATLSGTDSITKAVWLRTS